MGYIILVSYHNSSDSGEDQLSMPQETFIPEISGYGTISILALAIYRYPKKYFANALMLSGLYFTEDRDSTNPEESKNLPHMILSGRVYPEISKRMWKFVLPALRKVCFSAVLS